MDIFENDDSITVLADMPGVKAEDLMDPRESVLALIGRITAAESPEEMNVLRAYEMGTGHTGPGFLLHLPVDASIPVPE